MSFSTAINGSVVVLGLVLGLEVSSMTNFESLPLTLRIRPWFWRTSPWFCKTSVCPTYTYTVLNQFLCNKIAWQKKL